MSFDTGQQSCGSLLLSVPRQHAKTGSLLLCRDHPVAATAAFDTPVDAASAAHYRGLRHTRRCDERARNERRGAPVLVTPLIHYEPDLSVSFKTLPHVHQTARAMGRVRKIIAWFQRGWVVWMVRHLTLHLTSQESPF